MARKGRRRAAEEGTTYWLSYSDMMAGLLLTFVLIIAFTMLRAQVQYDEKERQLLGKEQELLVQTDALETERETVATQSLLLEEQKKALTEQEEQLLAQQDKLLTQEEELKQQHLLLSELENLMASQQAKLDRIIGVRSALVEALKQEFDDSGLELSVDTQTGGIVFESSILFASGRSELKDTGQAFLDQFLPRYVKTLMGPDYREYISEIIIEGHTDDVGGYLYNLELSQKRAYSVAAYCLADDSKILSAAELEDLRKVVTTSGRSYSNPVLDASGSINADASRRVEIQFRLKDEEMIREMMEILSGAEPALQPSRNTEE